MMNPNHTLYNIREVLNIDVTDQQPKFSSINIDPLAVVWNQIHSRCSRLEEFISFKYIEE